MNLMLRMFLISITSSFTVRAETTSAKMYYEYQCGLRVMFIDNATCEWRINGSAANSSHHNERYKDNSCFINVNYQLPPDIQCFHVMQGQLFKPYDGLIEREYLMVKATHKQEHSSHKYNCHFTTEVDYCHWMINGVIYYHVHYHNYAEYAGHEYDTFECKIAGDENANELTELNCLGLIKTSYISTAVIGEPVEIPCLTNERGNCRWKRNYVEIDVNGGHRYGYTGVHGGIDAVDCSIAIQPVQAIDIAEWTCEDPTDHGIYIVNRLRLDIDKYANAPKLDANYQYDCHFKVAVDSCRWIINHISTADIATYTYEYLEGSGSNTFDCSIKGKPNATRMPNSINCMGVKMGQSIKADDVKEFVFLERTPTASTIYSAFGKFPFRYECEFGTDVKECFWKINGSTVDISLYHYNYTNDNRIHNVNCSIISDTTSNPVPITVTCIGKIETALITTAINETVKLDCKTSIKVGCHWMRNNAAMAINGSYEYIEDDGMNTFNCSITIKGVKAIDEGEWICMGKTIAQDSPQMIGIYRLSIETNGTDGKGRINALFCGIGALLAFVVMLFVIYWQRKGKRLSPGPCCGNCSDYRSVSNVQLSTSKETSDGHLIPTTIEDNVDAIHQPQDEKCQQPIASLSNADPHGH